MKLPVSELARMVMAIVFASAALLSSAAYAQSREELKERFKQRDPQVTQLKAQGKIGETWQGFVEIVNQRDKPLARAEQQLLDEENADRRKLYQIIANRSDIRESPEDVGINNALRNFASAKPNEYLKVRVGPWVTRGDVARLKKDGKVGETWEGYIEAVDRKAADDAKVAAVVNAENAARKYVYERQARQRRSTADQEAERAGRQNIDQAKSGEFVKGKDRKWTRKR